MYCCMRVCSGPSCLCSKDSIPSATNQAASCLALPLFATRLHAVPQPKERKVSADVLAQLLLRMRLPASRMVKLHA